MGGCCTGWTTFRLLGNSGFYISKHGLAVLFDIWNKLYYTRHIKYVWMDHLTGVCFKNSHSSALAWLSWYASNKSYVPLASLSLLYLWQNQVPRSAEQFVTAATRPYSCFSFVEMMVAQTATWVRPGSLTFRKQFFSCAGGLLSCCEFLTVTHLHVVWQGSLCHN